MGGHSENGVQSRDRIGNIGKTIGRSVIWKRNFYRAHFVTVFRI
ncbi:hypothetical protein SAMN02910263_02245 [Butyrivibrio sp. INlla16]|nr:hypothetical protein SAMN02910263_02245 [Butyrivibrio sp. INlla16]